MQSLEDRIRGLSQEDLRVFKQQLPERLKQLGELDRNTALSQLKQMPELADVFQPPTQPVPQQTVKTTPLQKGLNVFGAPFQWVGEHITEPFGAVATAPFTPALAGGRQPNESALAYARRQYEQWKEPEFTMPWGGKFRPTKGLVETLPWFAVPGVGQVARGLGTLGKVGQVAGVALKYSPLGLAEAGAGKVLGLAGKGVGKAISSAPIVEDAMAKVGQWTLPAKELLNKAYKQDNIRRFAQWAEDKPIIGNVFRTIGGESIFVKAESQLPEDIVQREIINRVRLQNIGVNMQGANMPRLTRFGDPSKVLGITEDGIVNSAIPKSGQSRYLNDILENPDAYNFATKEAKQFIQEFSSIRKDLAKLLEADGLKQSPKVHRIVKGIQLEDGRVVESKFGSDPSLSRIYETQEEAALAHLQKGQKLIYGVNPNEIMQYEYDRTINRIARKRFTDAIKPLGKTARDKFAEIYPEKANEIARLGERQSAAKNALDVVQRVLSYKATSIPGATLAKIGRELPDMAGRIRILFELKPPTTEKIISQMSRELRMALKTNPTELKRAVRVISNVETTWRETPKITMMDIEDAIKNLNMHADIEARLITAGYKETVKANKQFFKDFMTANRDALETIINEAKTAARPLRIDRYKFLQGYAGRERMPHAVGEVTERPFERIPEFRKLFFPDEIVTYMEKHYQDEGTKWVRNMGSLSAMSRNLTAVLDDSAPFIQGLFTFGRNPLVWAKSTIRQLEFLAKPENFTKYMAKPEIQALHTEMTKYGSTVQRFETFEALPQIEKLVGKIPKVGGVVQRLEKETYGRAEAAFTGFGQLARDNMWKSLRRPNMSEAELQELARTLDLMTGNLSTKAMGIVATQRDLESAFGFFSPRFTRASLAFIGDMFKGGIAGNEARKSIAGLMASGSAMYLGVCKATGQEPDFDPRSGKFMTIKVGDDHVGIGGMLYSLARLGGNLTTVDNPTDLLKLDRFDNPFIKFLYGKSAPLTGLMVGAFEQKNYFGQPFENTGDWAKFLAEKVLPFGVQPFLEKGRETPTSVTAQLAGMRVFPKAPWELRDEARQTKSQELHKVDFTSLTKLEQNKIDKLPEIQKLTERIKTEGRETPENIAWNNWNQEGESIENTYRKTITLASKEYEATDNGLIFRSKVDEANSNKRALYAQRAINPQYATIQAYFNTPRTPETLAKMNPLDIAREEYYNLMYDLNTMYDQYGNYNFDLADQKETLFVQKYGQKALDYVQEYTGSKWDEPTPMKILREAREVLKPYWDIETKIWNQNPPEYRRIYEQWSNLNNKDPREAKRFLYGYPQVAYVARRIALEKKRLKLRDKQISQALNLFY